MAFRSGFVAALLGWTALVLLTGALVLWSFSIDGLGAARLVAALACIGSVLGLWHHVQRTNLQLARFIDAIRYGDLTQSFDLTHQGSGFAEVGTALNEVIRRLRDERHKSSDDMRFYRAVLDDAPTALLIIDEGGRVELGNKAARRLLVKHQSIRIEDFREYGEAFADSLGDSSISGPRLVPLIVDSVPQNAMVSTAVVQRLGGLFKVVALQPIQTELNTVEIAAQSDLIRVLTHEIMNSLTPITSLAHTAADLVTKAQSGEGQNLADARAAVETLARRADGVMHFVESYRQISRAPTVQSREFDVGPWSREIAALLKASGMPENLDFRLEVDPEDMVIDADPDLLFQVLINLLRNAVEAACSHSDHPVVSLTFSLTRGGLTNIEIADNGQGVPKSLRQDVFLPFFTTKEKGTGVGLSLARQIILAHRGSISLRNAPDGGAVFRVVL